MVFPCLTLAQSLSDRFPTQAKGLALMRPDVPQGVVSASDDRPMWRRARRRAVPRMFQQPPRQRLGWGRTRHDLRLGSSVHRVISGWIPEPGGVATVRTAPSPEPPPVMTTYGVR